MDTLSKENVKDMNVDQKTFISLPFEWSVFLNHIDIGLDHMFYFSQRELEVMIQAESLNVLL